jgi:hypothetical protein
MPTRTLRASKLVNILAGRTMAIRTTLLRSGSEKQGKTITVSTTRKVALLLRNKNLWTKWLF